MRVHVIHGRQPLRVCKRFLRRLVILRCRTKCRLTHLVQRTELPELEIQLETRKWFEFKFLWIIMMTLPLSSCKLKWQCHHNFVKQKQPSKEEFWLSGRTVLNCWNKYSLLIFYFHRFQTVPEETLGQFWRLPRGCFARIYFAEYKFIFFSQNLKRLHVKFLFWMTSICQLYLFIQWWKIQ